MQSAKCKIPWQSPGENHAFRRGDGFSGGVNPSGRTKCGILCHCEGACARGNLRCAFAHKMKLEEKFTPEIPTPVCALARNDTIFRLCGCYAKCKMQNVKCKMPCHCEGACARGNLRGKVMSDVGNGFIRSFNCQLSTINYQLSTPSFRPFLGMHKCIPYATGARRRKL